MNKKAISYAQFLSYLEEERLVLTSGIKDNWDAQRHVDYIVELQSNGNADNVQYLLSYTGNLEESVEVVISLSSRYIIKFRIKTLNEKKREYLDQHWQEVLDDLVLKVEENNPLHDNYIEAYLPQLKHYDRNAVETLMAVHENYKKNRKKVDDGK